MKTGDIVQHRDANRSGCDIGLVTVVTTTQPHMVFVHVQWGQKAKIIKGYMPNELVVINESR